jgi:small subunit ribosomal protein S8
MMSDPIADMLTRVRNACKAGHKKVDIPFSKMKKAVIKLLLDYKFINSYRYVEDSKGGVLRIYLKYTSDNESVIKGIRRISTPGRRQYVRKDKLPKILGGLGIAILSTSKGIVTDKEAKKMQTGGEVICYVW